MTPTDLSRLPKVLLHDHLDGGLRPATIIDLARTSGYDLLPSHEAAELASWFHQGNASSLESYLESFEHTIAVMQDASALRRVAYEAAEDLAADGVVYAECRFAPSLHTRGGLDRAEVIEAVLEGFEEGLADHDLPVGVIVDAMRQGSDSIEVAKAAAEFVGRGVVGFDLAGPEAGYPATAHLEACEIARKAGLHLTIHAGEGHFGGPAGLLSIIDALECEPERIGHGVRLSDDVTVSSDGEVTLGDTATLIRERRLALEQCPTSNLHVKAVSSAAEHSIGLLYRSGLPVTVNTDNRLMSGIRLSDEFGLVIEHHGFEVADLESVTMTAVDAAFCDDATRERIRERVRVGYA